MISSHLKQYLYYKLITDQYILNICPMFLLFLLSTNWLAEWKFSYIDLFGFCLLNVF